MRLPQASCTISQDNSAGDHALPSLAFALLAWINPLWLACLLLGWPSWCSWLFFTMPNTCNHLVFVQQQRQRFNSEVRQCPQLAGLCCAILRLQHAWSWLGFLLPLLLKLSTHAAAKATPRCELISQLQRNTTQSVSHHLQSPSTMDTRDRRPLQVTTSSSS